MILKFLFCVRISFLHGGIYNIVGTTFVLSLSYKHNNVFIVLQVCADLNLFEMTRKQAKTRDDR